MTDQHMYCTFAFYESHEWAVMRDPEEISPNQILNPEQTREANHKEAIKKKREADDYY